MMVDVEREGDCQMMVLDATLGKQPGDVCIRMTGYRWLEALDPANLRLRLSL